MVSNNLSKNQSPCTSEYKYQLPSGILGDKERYNGRQTWNTAPPWDLACKFSELSSDSMAISSPPRSRMSPTWTSTYHTSTSYHTSTTTWPHVSLTHVSPTCKWDSNGVYLKLQSFKGTDLNFHVSIYFPCGDRVWKESRITWEISVNGLTLLCSETRNAKARKIDGVYRAPACPHMAVWFRAQDAGQHQRGSRLGEIAVDIANCTRIAALIHTARTVHRTHG
jgi:hypothetical protein